MNLLITTPIHYDGLSFYRALGPANLMQRQDGTLNVRLAEDINWSSITWADVLLIQRPAKPDMVEIAHYAKQCGVKVWVDHDDDFYNIDTSNKAFLTYKNQEAQKAIRACTQLANVLTVTTQELKNVYKHPNTIIVPNAVPDYVAGLLSTPAPKIHSIVWRGSDTHVKDLLDCKDELLDFAVDNPQMPWMFIGYNPFFITQSLKRSKYHGIVDCVQLYHLLAHTNASIAIVPLEDSVFNRSKSNIAWMEHMCGGSIVVAPDMPEWRRPGVVNYEQGKLKKTLQDVIAMPYDIRSKIVKYGQDYLKQYGLLSYQNKKRFKLLEDLCTEK